jgi:UDP-2,3-diacylglucosamine pyrophosphatase LpxH
MTEDTDNPVYYVISDLHIGGDEQLENVPFLDELLSFLERLEQTDEDAELIINGDAFGLWEFTGIDGPAKFDVLVERYPSLFEQLRATGETMPITLIPGNHDHELAAYDEYRERLGAYNVDLVQAESMTRPVGGRTIYFEHGHQRDPNNRIDDFGNPHVTPLGYYYNTRVTSTAGQLSDRGRFNWLKDLQAVTPTQRMPNWLVSKYFYREMNPVLRYGALPFLLLFNISAVMALIAGLDLAGIWSLPVERTQAFLGQFGLAGTAAYLLLALNATVAGLLLVVAIPLSVLVRDVRKTVERFGIFEADLTVDPTEPYEAAAREVFEANPETAVFCYGHTHRSKVSEVDDRLLVNTGTWLKRLHRRDVVAGLLPPVFYPSYQLCVVRIAAQQDDVVVDYEEVEKPNSTAEELTRTERLLTLGREPDPELPERSTVPARQAEPASPTAE